MASDVAALQLPRRTVSAPIPIVTSSRGQPNRPPELYACSPPYWGPATCTPFGNPASVASESNHFHEYVKSRPDEIRKSLAEYFSTGRGSALDITVQNFHHFYHAGQLSQHQGLTKYCLKFYESCHCNQLLLNTIEQSCHCCWRALLEGSVLDASGCPCIEDKSKRGPEYAVLFISRGGSEKKQKITSLRISPPLKKFTMEINKLNRFGNGFAACSVQIEGSPFVVLTGGAGKNEKTASMYDVVLDKWDKPVKLNCSRQHHMTAVVEDVVYIFGGIGASSVERFDPVSKSCDLICDLSVGVNNAAIAVHQSKIYIFGGRFNGGDVSTIQYIDTVKKTSRILGNLPCTCSYGQAVVLGNDIYIATGQGHMIRYNVHVDKAEMCAPQSSKRTQFALFVKKDEIYMVGGRLSEAVVSRDGKTNAMVSQYCPETDQWTVKYEMGSSIHVCTSCVVRFSQRCPIIPFQPS